LDRLRPRLLEPSVAPAAPDDTGFANGAGTTTLTHGGVFLWPALSPCSLTEPLADSRVPFFVDSGTQGGRRSYLGAPLDYEDDPERGGVPCNKGCIG
jgi:hypothetical protein